MIDLGLIYSGRVVEEAVQVTYTTTLADLHALQVRTLKRSPAMRLRFAFWWTVVTIGCVVLATSQIANRPLAAAAVLAAGLTFAATYPFLYWRLVERSIRAQTVSLDTYGVVGRVTLMLNEESLTERTATVTSEARWRDMVGFEVVGENTYVYVTALSVAIIPRHGFERDEEYQAVRDFVADKLDEFV